MLTRALEGSGNHTVWRWRAYNAPIDLSSYKSCRDAFRGVSRATLELFLAKVLGPWVNPFKVKKGRIFKMLAILTEKNRLPVFLCLLGHYYSYEEYEKQTFESSVNAVSQRYHHISAKVNSLGYTGRGAGTTFKLGANSL